MFKKEITGICQYRNGSFRKSGPRILRTDITITDEEKPEYYSILKYVNPEEHTPFTKFNSILKEPQREDWRNFIKNTMMPITEELKSKCHRDTSPANSQPFQYILPLLRNWSVFDIPESVGGDINSSIEDISDHYRTRQPVQAGLNEEHSQLILDANTSMVRSLVFNVGLLPKKLRDGLIDHDTYEFTVGEKLIINYTNQDDLTEEENNEINVWPFIAEIASITAGPNNPNGDLIVYEYEEIDVTNQNGQFINKKYRRATYDRTIDTVKGELVTSVFPRNTVLFGDINLTIDGYLHKKTISRYRNIIRDIRAEAIGQEKFLHGDYSQEEDFSQGKNWLKNN